MPSGVSDYGSRTWLSALFGIEPLPAQYFFALTSHQPGASMDGDILAAMEPTDGAYQRQAYPIGVPLWASNGPYLTNTRPLAFPTPSKDWGYLTHFALCTAATSGQIFAWGEMFNPQYVSQSIAMLIPPGALVLGLHALDNTIAA
jgi:hypothetical protein